jgi:hypothetical protein
LYGAFVWVRTALNSQKWHFLARAVDQVNAGQYIMRTTKLLSTAVIDPGLLSSDTVRAEFADLIVSMYTTCGELVDTPGRSAAARQQLEKVKEFCVWAMRDSVGSQTKAQSGFSSLLCHFGVTSTEWSNAVTAEGNQAFHELLEECEPAKFADLAARCIPILMAPSSRPLVEDVVRRACTIVLLGTTSHTLSDMLPAPFLDEILRAGAADGESTGQPRVFDTFEASTKLQFWHCSAELFDDEVRAVAEGLRRNPRAAAPLLPGGVHGGHAPMTAPTPKTEGASSVAARIHAVVSAAAHSPMMGVSMFLLLGELASQTDGDAGITILTNYLAWCTDDDTSVRATAAEALSQALPARADLPATYHSLDTSFEQAKSNTSTEDAAPSDAPMDVEQTAKNSQEDEL